MNQNVDSDKEKILDHIHSIFQAFLRKDRDAVKNAHSDDWVGFLGPSTSIERGIDAYMVNADMSLDNIKGTDYKIHDTEIQIYGEIAIVYYVASYDYLDENDQTKTFPLRSVDIYRRTEDDWIQAGSHIAVIPTGGTWGEGD